MKKIVLLGCGFHGRGIAYQLARSGVVELRVLDLDPGRAQAVAANAGVEYGAVDVTDGKTLRAALEGADLVVNAVGPYHKTALSVIEAAIDCGVSYVDMTDDHEVAEAVLLDPVWHERARRRGVTIVIACGVVPGLSGMLVRYGSNQLDATHRVDVRFAWNYNRQYPAAIQHFLRINSGRGPQYLDAKQTRMPPLSGAEEVEFLEPVGRTTVYYTGVPDPVAIARFLPEVRHATAKGCFYQSDANRLLGDMIRWGFTSYDIPTSQTVAPMDYLVNYLASPAGTPFFEIPRREVPLALRVELEGIRAGKSVKLHYEAHDHSRRATTAFTALAALSVANGQLTPGVFTPEAWPDASRFLAELVKDPHVRISHWRDREPPQELHIRAN